MLGPDLPGDEIDVRQGVQLGHHDVDVVGADAMGQDGDTLAVPPSGDGDELAGGMPELDIFQQFGDHVDPAGVAHKDDVVGQFFRLQVNVEHGAVAVDDEFGFRDSHGNSDYAVMHKYSFFRGQFLSLQKLSTYVAKDPNPISGGLHRPPVHPLFQ